MNKQKISSLECQEIKRIIQIIGAAMGKLHLSCSGQRYSPSHFFINLYGINPICYSRFSARKTTQTKKRTTSLSLTEILKWMPRPPHKA